MDRTRLLIVDDHAQVREELRRTLELDVRLEVVGEAANGLEALRLVEEVRPDAVLLDLRMPLLDGLETARRIKQRQPEVRVVAFTIYQDWREAAMAAVALRVMHAAPQAIDRAVLSGTLTRPVAGATASLNKLLVWMYGNPRTAPLVGRMFQLPPEDRPVFAETARLTPRDTYPRLLGELYRAPFPDKLKSIDVPILAITGQKDAGMLKSGVGDLVRTLPNVVGYYAPGVGHAWNAENPDPFADVVRAWLLDKPLPELLIPHAG